MFSNRLRGKAVLITGASSGIGKACASFFAQMQSKLILVARRGELLSQIKDKLLEQYPDLHIYTYTLDIRDKDSISNLFNTLPSQIKMIDIVINNAGLSLGLDEIAVSDSTDWDTMVDTNIKGLAYTAKEAVINMKKHNNPGHIINIGSIAGTFPYANSAVYCASKAAVHAFSRSLREECIKYGIRVSEVMPGVVNTEFSTVRFNGDKARADNVYLGFKALSAEDIAEVILYTANLPQHINLAESMVTPTAQATPSKIHKTLQN